MKIGRVFYIFNFLNFALGVMLPEDSPQKCLNLERRVYQAPEKKEKIFKTHFFLNFGVRRSKVDSAPPCNKTVPQILILLVS
jgi:hypothetical protein